MRLMITSILLISIMMVIFRVSTCHTHTLILSSHRLPQERCFQVGRDIVVPDTLPVDHLRSSPFWRGEGSPFNGRSTRLFFAGSLCWPLWEKVHSLGALARKCNVSYYGNVSDTAFDNVARYSFGLRYRIWSMHRKQPGFRLIAQDFSGDEIPSSSLGMEIRRSQFCLCPSGTGFGLRIFHVAIMGCVPVVVQHDGVHPPVAQV